MAAALCQLLLVLRVRRLRDGTSTIAIKQRQARCVPLIAEGSGWEGAKGQLSRACLFFRVNVPACALDALWEVGPSTPSQPPPFAQGDPHVGTAQRLKRVTLNGGWWFGRGVKGQLSKECLPHHGTAGVSVPWTPDVLWEVDPSLPPSHHTWFRVT